MADLTEVSSPGTSADVSDEGTSVSTQSSRPASAINTTEPDVATLTDCLRDMTTEAAGQPSPPVANPYLAYEEQQLNKMLEDVSNEAHLSYKNIKMENSAIFSSWAPKYAFQNNRFRTTVQVAGVAEEVILAESAAAVCKAVGSTFGFISTDGTSKDAGSSSTHLDQRYLVVMDTSDKRLVKCMPSPGYKVEMIFRLDYGASDFAPVQLKDDEIAPAAWYLASACISGPKDYDYSDSDSESDNCESAFHDWMSYSEVSSVYSDEDNSGEGGTGKDDTGKDDSVKYSDEPDFHASRKERTEAYTEALQNRRQNLAKVVFQFNSSAEFPASCPDRNELAMKTACLLLPRLERKSDAVDRIRSWLKKNKWFKFSSEYVDWTKVEWHGRRTKPPQGVRSTQAFFIVETPAQPYWPPFLKAPLVKVNLPVAENRGKLQRTVDMMGIRIRGKLSHKPDLKVQWFEGEVHKKLHMAPPESYLMAWWRYILDFKHMEPRHHRNLHSVFPGIAKHLEQSNFSGEHETAARALMSTKAGKLIVSGCPGSGKSTFCQKVASAVLEERWRPKAGWPNSREDSNNAPSTQIIYTSPQNEQCKDAIRRFKQMNPKKRACRLYGYNREMYALLCGDDDAEPEPVSGEKSTMHVKVSRSPAQPFNKEVIQHEDKRDPCRDPDSLSSIAQGMASKEVLSVIEKSRKLWKTDRKKWQREKQDYRPVAHKLLALAVKSQHAFFGTTVAVAQCHDHLYAKGHHDDGDRPLGNPALLIVDEVGRLTETHALIGISIFRDVPTIFAGDHDQFGPIVPTSNTRLNYTVGSKTWKFSSRFGAQREMSFLRRAAVCGGIDETFTLNHRVYGSVGEFPCQWLYKDKMTQVNTADNSATEAVGKWFRDFGGAATNSLFVDLNSEEQQQGTSKVNMSSAFCAVQIAVHIGREMRVPLMEDFKQHDNALEMKDSIRKGRILILVAYSAHVAKVQYFLKKVSDHEVDKSRITVRSIGDSPSHEAEIVIVDLVRTESPGFLTEPARLKVAATRAQLGTVWISNTKLCLRDENSLKTLITYHTARGAVFRVAGYKTICYKCHCAGHEKINCPEAKIVCSICDANSDNRHSVRECQEARKLSARRWQGEMWMTPPQSVDTVDRNPFKIKGPKGK
ncbi:hypothetical protein NQ176_g9647 [Zarea fungicola]|uniref:Uncharacterized protein n=1 Tax=Zarea fungicola TaxID=93591 RepID=A0ACC1MKY2_9HYPO|nr:hypothetical protein NQ176_g9647 [Lecanicillium fungicola]